MQMRMHDCLNPVLTAQKPRTDCVMDGGICTFSPRIPANCDVYLVNSHRSSAWQLCLDSTLSTELPAHRLLGQACAFRNISSNMNARIGFQPEHPADTAGCLAVESSMLMFGRGRTADEGEDGEGEGAGGEHHLQLDEAVAAGVQLNVDVLLSVLHILACAEFRVLASHNRPEFRLLCGTLVLPQT